MILKIIFTKTIPMPTYYILSEEKDHSLTMKTVRNLQKRILNMKAMILDILSFILNSFTCILFQKQQKQRFFKMCTIKAIHKFHWLRTASFSKRHFTYAFHISLVSMWKQVLGSTSKCKNYLLMTIKIFTLQLHMKVMYLNNPYMYVYILIYCAFLPLFGEY